MKLPWPPCSSVTYVCLSLSFLPVLSSHPWTDTKQHFILCVILLCLYTVKCDPSSLFKDILAYGWCTWNSNWQIRIQQAGKLYCPDINLSYYNQANFLSGDGIKKLMKRDLQSQSPYQIVKGGKYETFCSSKLQIVAKNWSPVSGMATFS